MNRNIFLLAWLPALLAGAAMAQPAMKWGDESRLGRPFAKDPSVVRFQGRYLMYYSMPGGPEGMSGWAVGIAESRDLRAWRKVGEVLPTHAYEAKGLAAPGARVIDGKVHLFYQTYGNMQKDAICHAESADGLKFVKDASNPIFRPAGAWTVGRAIDAEVVPFQGKWFLYAATRDPQMKVQMLTGAELVKLMISGFLRVDGWAAGFPNVVPTSDALEFMGAVDGSQIPSLDANYVS